MIGNKTDLEESRVIKKEQAQKIKEDYDLDYFIETSAKTGMNAEEIFIQAAKVLYRDYIEYKKEKKEKEMEKEMEKENNNEKLIAKEDGESNKKGCC